MQQILALRARRSRPWFVKSFSWGSVHKLDLFSGLLRPGYDQHCVTTCRHGAGPPVCTHACVCYVLRGPGGTVPFHICLKNQYTQCATLGVLFLKEALETQWTSAFFVFFYVAFCASRAQKHTLQMKFFTPTDQKSASVFLRKHKTLSLWTLVPLDTNTYTEGRTCFENVENGSLF